MKTVRTHKARARTRDIKRAIAVAVEVIRETHTIEPDELVAAIGCYLIERAERSRTFRLAARKDLGQLGAEFAALARMDTPTAEGAPSC